jgi:hypothetical protein
MKTFETRRSGGSGGISVVDLSSCLLRFLISSVLQLFLVSIHADSGLNAEC